MLYRKDRVSKDEERFLVGIPVAGSGEGSREYWTLRTKSWAPGEPDPAHPDLEVGGSRALPSPPSTEARPVVRPFLVPGSRPCAGSLYLARHPGRSLGSQLPARSRAPAAPPAGCGETLASRYSGGQCGRRRGRGRGCAGRAGMTAPGPALRLASLDGWSRFRPETPGLGGPPGAGAHYTSQRAPRLWPGVGRAPGFPVDAGSSLPQLATLRSCQEGLGAGTRPVASFGYACPRVRIQPSILASNVY